MEGELERVVSERDRSVAAMENSVEEHNTNQVSAERIKSANDQQKQYIAHLIEELKRIESSVAYFQVEENYLYSKKNIAISKVHKVKGEINTITSDLSTRINKEEAKDKTQQLKSVVSENIRILDNKCPENIEILRGKDKLEGKLKGVREEKDISAAHTRNLN